MTKRAEIPLGGIVECNVGFSCLWAPRSAGTPAIGVVFVGPAIDVQLAVTARGLCERRGKLRLQRQRPLEKLKRLCDFCLA